MGLLSWKEYQSGQQLPTPVVEEVSSDLLPDKPEETCDNKECVATPCQKLNEATQDEILSIKGVGPKTCEKLLQSRPFANLNDLETIGLTPRAVASLTNWIYS
jgi:DNA uptake protein ComE-like DNA-binding protein